MNLIEAISTRHSVRNYTDEVIKGEVEKELSLIIDECNKLSGLNIQLCLNEPQAFSGIMAKYGNFKNVSNYIALVGKKTDDLPQLCGYYGEKIVLKATQLGLNTCWVAATYSKHKTIAKVNDGENLLLVISLGYGVNNGTARKTKTIEQLSRVKGTHTPEWFINGMKAVQLAPTAINQQKFIFELDGNTVKAISLKGPFSKVDLGIAKCHFEIGANSSSWKWYA